MSETAKKTEKKRILISDIERNCLVNIIDQCLDKMKIEKDEQVETIGTLWNLKFKLRKLKY